MTREEAIHFANCLKNNYTIDFNDMEEFCDMVIKALKQEPCDCISRQQAVDKMQELEDEDIEMYGCSIPEGFDGKRAIEALNTLPSIQPKTDFEHKAEIVILQLRAEIENHCGLTKKNHCRYCSYCNNLMGIREILEIIDKYKAESETP